MEGFFVYYSLKVPFTVSALKKPLQKMMTQRCRNTFSSGESFPVFLFS